MKRTFLILTFIINFSFVYAQNLTDSIKHEVGRRVKSNINPGLAIAILHPDNSVDYYNFGIVDIKANKRVNEHTIFEIGSITKTFTASILLGLEKEINLDESILNFLPSIDNAKLASIKVSDLLNHKSGLPRLSEEFSPKDWSNPFSDYSKEKLTAELSNVKLDTSKQWIYSNLGYATLGRILEYATNKDRNSLFEGIFAKLGLVESFINRFDVPESRLAQPSYLGITFSFWDFAAESGYAGTIKSTSADLIKYLIYHKKRNPLFIPDKRVESPFETKNNAYGTDQLFYKNGWFIFRPDEETEIITHNGGSGGFSSFMAYNKTNETGVVILSNSLSLNDDIGLKILYPKFKLKHPKKTIAYELAEMVKQGKADELHDLYLSNKVSGEFEVDIIQIYWLERFCFGQKQYEYSNELSTILIDILPDDWEVYDLKGQNLEKLNQVGDALANYKKAKILNPGSTTLDVKIERCLSNKIKSNYP